MQLHVCRCSFHERCQNQIVLEISFSIFERKFFSIFVFVNTIHDLFQRSPFSTVNFVVSVPPPCFLMFLFENRPFEVVKLQISNLYVFEKSPLLMWLKTLKYRKTSI